MHGLFSVALASAFVGLSAAQDLSVPSTWREDDTSFQRLERVQIAHRAIHTLVGEEGSDPSNFGGLGWWPSANAWSAIALSDLYSHDQTHRKRVTTALTTAFNANPPFRQTDFNDDSGWWTNAALYAYTAYHDDDQLNQAAAGWEEINQWVITSDDGSSQKGSIQGSCNGQSMVGGVFWNGEDGDYQVNAITASLYALTSAQLYKFSGNDTYASAANETLQWIVNLMYKSDDNLIDDHVMVDSCTFSDGEYFTYNQGMFAAAVAVYTNVTGDNSFMNTATLVAASAMKQTTRFQGEDGIITEGEDDSAGDASYFRGAYLRGLSLMYWYGNNQDPNNALNILIHSYVDVQYNALIELDSNDASGVNTTAYGVDWHGPYNASDVHAFEMIPAVDALAAAILTNNNGNGSGFPGQWRPGQKAAQAAEAPLKHGAGKKGKAHGKGKSAGKRRL